MFQQLSNLLRCSEPEMVSPPDLVHLDDAGQE
jgi:hypothetical protein